MIAYDYAKLLHSLTYFNHSQRFKFQVLKEAEGVYIRILNGGSFISC